MSYLECSKDVAQEDGLAYEINLERIKNQREGSVILDILNFRKNVHTWMEISVLILIVDDTVEYVLYSGEKNIDTLKENATHLVHFKDLMVVTSSVGLVI